MARIDHSFSVDKPPVDKPPVDKPPDVAQAMFVRDIAPRLYTKRFARNAGMDRS